MSILTLLLLLVIETFAGTVIFYIVGRILLPEIGLHAPGLWVWFWVMFFLAALDFIKSVIKEVTS